MTRAQYVAQCAELLRLPLRLETPPPPPGEDEARAHALRDVLRQLGFQTQARCVGCDRQQPFTGINSRGLCVACALGREAEQVSADDCVCWDERETRDTEPCEAP